MQRASWLSLCAVLFAFCALPSVAGCGSSTHDRCANTSGMPQGDMPCYEPPPSSPQRNDDEQKHEAPGSPMPSR